MVSYLVVSHLSLSLNTYLNEAIFHNIFCSHHWSSLWPPLDTYNRVPQRPFSLCLSNREKQQWSLVVYSGFKDSRTFFLQVLSLKCYLSRTIVFYWNGYSWNLLCNGATFTDIGHLCSGATFTDGGKLVWMAWAEKPTAALSRWRSKERALWMKTLLLLRGKVT